MNKGYFDSDNYDDNKHWHVGYYKDNQDIECIAFQRKENGTWDVFFNDFKDNESEIFTNERKHIDKNFGVFLFNAKKEEVEGNFGQWVTHELLPLRKTLR